MTRGFSLIETIVYIALLGFMMSGAVITAYQVTQSSFVVSEKDTVQEEGNFVLRKLEHSFVGASAVAVGGSGCSQTLEITRYGGSKIYFQRNSNKIELKRDAGSYTELTTDNVEVECLAFDYYSGPPGGVTGTTTIDGVDFVITKYVR